MPRTLAAVARSAVSGAARTRGEQYFRDGRVTIAETGDDRVAALVRGSRTYRVLLELEGTCLQVRCTCPRFADVAGVCKHIWATFLAADLARALDVPIDLWIDAGEDDFADEDAYLDDPGGDLFGEGDPMTPWSPPARLTAAQRASSAAAMKARWAERLGRGKPAARATPAPPPAWQQFLAEVNPPAAHDRSSPGLQRSLPAGELIYVIDLARSHEAGGVAIGVMTRDRKKSGEWGKPRPLPLDRATLTQLPDAADREILERMAGGAPSYAYGGGAWGGYTPPAPLPLWFSLSSALQRDLAPRLCATGRLFLRGPFDPLDPRGEPPLLPIAWSPPPFSFIVRVSGDAGSGYRIDGVLRGDGVERVPSDLILATDTLALWRAAGADASLPLGPLDLGRGARWLGRLANHGSVTVPATDAAALVETLATSDLAHVECPDELRVEPASEPFRPVLRVTRPPAHRRGYPHGARLDATLRFAYGDREVSPWNDGAVVFDRERRRLWRRDRDGERTAMTRLHTLGIRQIADWHSGGTRLDLLPSVLPRLVRTLIGEGWTVEADGALYRAAGATRFELRSGVDWFELHGGIDFDGITAPLPTLLAAARRGDGLVALGDGTFGLLPDDWLSRHGRIAALGAVSDDHVRFTRTQTALLDAWLAAQPAVSCDAAFAKARTELARFDGITPADPPPDFRGRLRPYQRDALGWFEFLRRFGFGGCLADEMGLGKTVMVLAALAARRTATHQRGRSPLPSLIVVPRSLVFNWRQEAARFAPSLRVLDASGAERRAALERVADYDVALVTYGTLRKDIASLKDLRFDYAILDEAQAIKNAKTNAAKAARLLQADHRLALSGTPVENHLGELWSLFDFLNPGILGTASLFSSGVKAADEDSLSLVARGLRPFILRRTKDQVAAELPARTEQTIYCDLEPPQRRLYDELKNHYRAALLGRIDNGRVPGAKLQILEALLRLRQAACHPALIDRARHGDGSAKLDVLVPRLQELAEDGRKVLVFSQFTSLLSLLRTRLDEAGLAYEYLDGKTRDRAARVERFQHDGGPPLFLISLKAGGLGLNLTAAEHVFLLDPWWNPAVEAQAIDRTHRIGQTRPVFAFRLIARDTVEERVLELQASKRHLADAIVRADAGLIKDLRREDLELLLS